jgi:hypothetical protein
MGVPGEVCVTARFRVAIVSVAIACCVGCGSHTGPDSGGSRVEIRGQIFGQVVQGPQNPNGGLAPDTYVNPEVGAVISTSLDSATTTSDSSGNFVLRTNTETVRQAFTLRITAAGYPTYDRVGCWQSGASHKIALTWTQSDPIVSVACN